MSVYTDLTFFTNEPERNLYDRFNKILKSNTQFYDILVGYFRTSGFYLMYPAMKDVEKIRVLVGLNVDSQTVQIIQKSKEEQMSFEMSHREVKKEFSENIEDEMKDSEDSHRVEEGVKTFIKWLQTGKLEIRIYPDAPIHAKVYIVRKDPIKVPDQFGTVITGSSNFSKAGLINNLEFNVELKDSRDVLFALEKFEELWERSVDISGEYIETINNNTWIRDDITPYELFLKTLYEYFKEEINEDKNDMWIEYLPDGFMKLQYQMDAVTQAKKTLDAYNGVFISDVVGLGKTYISAMLAQRLNGKKLIICPPVLKDYWERTLYQFEVAGATVESLGKLDSILEDKEIMENTKYVFIDEAHRFRNDSTESFQKLHQICYNKKVILITATPQNNFSTDIASQIYLFQPRNNSTIIPNNKNIEGFFNQLDSKLKKHEKGSKKYTDTLKHNSEIIRDKVLRNIMIRRTRKEIMEYYKEDLEKQGLTFPELEAPKKIVYTYNDEIENVFNHTIGVIQSLSYARYKPLTYLNEIPKEVASMLTSQRNISGFMKSILIKRLESSFEAFKKTLNRFIVSHNKFIEMCKEGEVYISKKIDVYELLDNGDDEKLMELVEDDLVQHFSIDKFNDQLFLDLERDLLQLRLLQEEWEEIIEDPKKDQFLYELETNPLLKDKKMIIFTESKETAEYVGSYLEDYYPGKIIVFSGQSSKSLRLEIEANYNPNHTISEQKDDIKYLVTTDVLAEGINLHRSNIIINYDLPWNPTKVMQRVGRINRVGTQYDKIHVFNFFPTAQANAHLPLEENIMLKIQAFHDTLGEDFKYLSEDEEVTSHNLYHKLNNKEGLEMEEEHGQSELEYLNIIRDVRDNEKQLYEKIKKLPQKSKSGRVIPKLEQDQTITFLRKGGLKKFFISNGEDSEEIYFYEAMKYLRVDKDEKKITPPKEYFDHLELNKLAFEIALTEEIIDNEKPTKTGNDLKVIRILRVLRKDTRFTDKEEETIDKLIKVWEDGNIPASITKDVLKQIKGITDSLRIYYQIISLVPIKYLETRREDKKINISGNTKVILSSYLKKGEE